MMFTPIKHKGHGVLNDTVINTPQPQATSTVRRKSTLKSKFSSERHSIEEKCKQEVSCENKLAQKKDSSLGLLDNMSVLTDMSVVEDKQKFNYPNADMELEYARKLLQKCSDIKNFPLTIDTNKENNANVQNITSNLLISNLALPNEAYIPELDKESSINRLANNTSATSITFEPNEITARSSGVTSTTMQYSLNKPFNDINFSSAEIVAQLNNEIIAQINNEEFLSGSKMIEQLSVDEARWQQDCTYSMPVMSKQKHELDLSSFSGIIGQMDLSTESCAGRKLSAGQYFERKSNNIGEILGNNEKVRPSLGFASETPIRKNNLQPLIESTIMTDATTLSMELKEKEDMSIPSTTRDVDKNSIISLSTIINTLQDVNSGTPRRLVDQLLMAQKQKKSPIRQDNARKETWILPCDRKSMLATPTGNFNKFDEDISLENFSTKLSLDSRIKDETKSEIIDLKQECSTMPFASNQDIKKAESFRDVCKEKLLKENANKNVTSSFNQDADDIIIGRNTDRLCNCIVGMTSEANVELVNNGDRWITYSIRLIEIQGDTQNIELNLSQDAILIKPNGVQSTKIEVKVTKMCKPLFIVLNIILSDMVAKSKWFMKHMIFVNPEQLELDVICDSYKQELDFQYILENSTKVLPIAFRNKNSVHIPVKLSILHDGPKIFSIDGTFDGLIKLNDSRDELTNLVLKPHEQFITYIKCEKLQSTSIDSSQEQPQYWTSKLIIYVQCNDGTILYKNEIPLYAQMGTCKIKIIDTEIPIVVSKQQGKLLNIINSGNIATHVSATIVPVEEYSNTAQDFSVKPNDIFLQVGESSSFLIVYKSQVSDTNSTDNERHAKVKLVAGNNVYHYFVSTEQKSLELEKENYLRCHTPTNAVSLSPATSPQSVTSSRSGSCDRNSPISIVSSVAVAGNTIPIKATHAALVWNSIKTGKSEIKEFTIRNTSNNKIKIQLDIWDDSKSFKFFGDRQVVNTSIVLAMQRQEIKTLAVAFSPYQVGSVTGKITIKHYTRESNDSQQHKIIPLYGYGGCSKVKISDTFKDASGKMWLSLGTLYSEATSLSANITVQNIGDLCSFAKIKVTPKVISPTMDSSWHVKPKELILDPKDAQRVSIEFHPKKEDFAILQRSEVSHVATISITYGDEPTRWRIRRLYNKIKESGESIGNENEAFRNIVHSICKAFPGEQLIPGLISIRDSIQNLSDLCTGVYQYEIMLTVEACADDTLPVHYDTDESQMYYSLISDTTHADEACGASFFASQTMIEHEAQHPQLQEKQFVVTPSTVVLNPPVRNEATVTILSSFKAAQPFQTNLSNSDYFSVVPAEGMLPSRKSFPLKIQCLQRIERNTQAVLEIYTENDKQDVLIKVIVKRQ